MADPPFRVVCERCGSEQVTREAWAEWDRRTQQWVLGALFDHAHCQACLARTRLAEVPIASG